MSKYVAPKEHELLLDQWDGLPFTIDCDWYSRPQVLRAMGEAAKAEHQWILTKDRMPDHNVAVLVFIPEEDDHITSGMWDISNEWTLLDDYRSTKGEVTHWMPLPNIPSKI